ncbi:MAG: malectin domain-containing carbohydrate-binding protein, partial [Akkermansiaceae bacterium]|nr:malectin domain-containing carbohydrate-binding protein [Akkermansiaceae bacterium]
MKQPILLALATLFLLLTQASAAVTSFTLVDADTNADIQTLKEGDVINLATIGTSNFSIRANVDVAPSSVSMVLTGATSHSQSEGSAPYALWGDNSGDYTAGSFNLGQHTLSATPSGGAAYTVNFSVVRETSEPFTGAFLEADGVVVMEVESAPVAGQWERRTNIAGYSGSEFYYCKSRATSGGADALDYVFTISNAGDYQVQVRSRIALGSSNTDANDSFIRLVDSSDVPVAPIPNENTATGTWYKFYQNTLNNWTWQTSNKDHDPHSLAWSLEAGQTYKLQISRRSEGHAIDKIVLWNRAMGNYGDATRGHGNSSALDPLAESERATLSDSGRKIAYIHGDVAADGTIPSGSAAPYDQMLLTDSGATGCSLFKAMVEAEGHEISQHYDATTTLDAAFLEQFDVVIFGLHQKIWSADEKAAFDTWLRAGGGALFYSDSAAGGLYSSVGAQNPVGQTAVNNVITPYGMQVLVDQADGVKAYRAGPDASHPVVSGRPVLEGEGVSPVALDPSSNAVALIPYVDHPDYKVSGAASITHTQNLTIANPEYAALALVEVEQGRLMAMFDRQPMWNDGPGSDIEMRDNREILRRVVNYLAGERLADGDGSVTISGELKQWHRVDLKQLAVYSSELADPNPFRDYRMNVTFTAPSGAQYLVPGYFATDGKGGDEGKVWMAHLNPNETGEWTYVVSFRSGADIAISLDANSGTAVAPFDGKTGSFTVAASDKSGDDFRAADKGMLINRGHHYLSYGGSGAPFLYTGPGIPENILGYRGFTNTTIGVGHEFTVHGTHWNNGDPDWNDGAGKNLIGALNYIADQGANCLYMMSNTIGGDGEDCFPHPTSTSTRDRYDLLKLKQWDIALAHAQARGIFLNWHLAEHETGNNTYYGGAGSNNQNVTNTMTVERKLYFRMLNAVFGHYNGLKWNLMEECEYATADRTAQMEYIKAIDPYDHPVTYQVGGIGISYDSYNEHLGQTDGIDAASFQGSASRSTMFNTIQSWRTSSASAGVKWTCAWDEPQKIENDNNDEVNGYPMGRRDKMWPCLMGGGDGFMWYIQKDGGGHGFDQRIEDFTIMQNAFNWSGHARDFLGALPLLEMSSSLDLVSSASGTDYTLAKTNDVYAIFNDRVGTGMTLDLSAASGSFDVRWFDPRNGGALQNGSVTTVTGGGVVSLGDAPNNLDKDWAVLVRRSPGTPHSLNVIGGSGDGQYLFGETVNITADAAPAGQVFDAWTGDLATVKEVNSASTTLTMPDHDITVSASYKEAPPVLQAINCGGSAFTASDGTNYLADTLGSGGDTYSSGDAIAGTTDDALFQTERYGMFTYEIPVGNGSYGVLLQFAEIYANSDGARVF